MDTAVFIFLFLLLAELQQLLYWYMMVFSNPFNLFYELLGNWLVDLLLRLKLQ